MPKYHFDIEQGSSPWFRVHQGIPTASNFDRIITSAGKASAQAAVYMNQLLAEALLGEQIVFKEESFENDYILNGRQNEEAAAAAFEFQTERSTRTVGFVSSDSGRVGCSPDRLVGEDGVLQCKCPSTQVHLSYLLDESELIKSYRVQCQGELWVCNDRELHWIIAYHRKLPPIILPVQRDEEFIRKIDAAVSCFCELMAQRKEKLESRYGPFSKPEPKRTKEMLDVEDFGITDEDIFHLLHKE